MAAETNQGLIISLRTVGSIPLTTEPPGLSRAEARGSCLGENGQGWNG